MSVFDIFDEISGKQVTKTQLGEERIFGGVVGIVASNYEKEMPGRICVNIPVRDENANQLKWAKVAAPYTGREWGQYFLPEENDQVLLLFEDGNIEKPYIVGCIPKDNDKFLKKSVDEKNKIKQIMTRHGSRITFEDDEEEGDKDKITVSTAKDSHQMVMDNGKKQILMQDKEGNCKIEMGTEKGEISIHAAKKLTVTVGDSITVTMNGDSGTVKIDAKKVEVQASDKLSLSCDGNAKLSGQQTIVEGSSSVKNQSSGMMTIEGKPIKLG